MIMWLEDKFTCVQFTSKPRTLYEIKLFFTEVDNPIQNADIKILASILN